MIPLFVPLIQEPYPLVFCNSAQKIGHLRVGVQRHFFREKGMVESIVRIVLPGVIFCDDRIDHQVQKQAFIPVIEKMLQDIRDPDILQQLPDDQIRPDPQAA